MLIFNSLSPIEHKNYNGGGSNEVIQLFQWNLTSDSAQLTVKYIGSVVVCYSYINKKAGLIIYLAKPFRNNWDI